jgi:hypothetical protein
MQAAFESFLTDISVCFLQRDLALWRSRLALPLSLITKSGPVVLTSDEAVARNFQLYLRASDAMSLDMVDRTPLSLEACDDGTWLGTFRTRLLSGGHLATSPYTSTSLMHENAGHLRMSSMLNARGHNDWTGDPDN